MLAGVCLGLVPLCGGARVRALLLVGAAAGSGAFHLGLQLERTRAGILARPAEMTLEARVADVRRSGTGARVRLDRVVRVGEGPPAPPGVLLYVDPVREPGLAASVPGERLRVRVRLRPPGGPRNPGGVDRDAADRRRGVAATGRVAHPRLVQVMDRGGPLARLHRLRGDLAARLFELGSGGALLAALALGERSGLPSELRDAFSALGISHLLAVSGLHLALAAGGTYAGGRRILSRCGALTRRGDARKAALAISVLAAAVQTLLAGAGVPVRRAWVLLLGAASDAARSRPALRGSGLSAAALTILAVEPAALFDAGAQLSFAAAAALTCDPVGARSRSGVLRSSASAILATAPLAALRFGAAAPGALLFNAIAVPLVGFVLLPAALVLVPALALAPEWSVTQWLAAHSAEGARRAARLALAVAPHAGAPSAPAAGGCLAAAALLSLLGLALPGTRARLLAATGVGVLLAFGPRAALEPPPPRAVFLDVGQGDAVLVQGRSGTLLVDAGGAWPGGDRGRGAVVPALRALGVERLDVLAVTHGDLDHRGGAPAVVEALPVGEVWLPRGSEDDPAFAELRAAAAQRGVPVLERGTGDPERAIGDLGVRSLWPDGQPRWRGNDASLVLHVTVAATGVLLPGDLGARAEAALAATAGDLRADLLLLPHHGSRTSGSDTLLAATAAQVAVASAPCHGRFGMPHPEVVARARRRGLSVWWTGRDGAVWAALGEPLWMRGSGVPRCRLAGGRGP